MYGPGTAIDCDEHNGLQTPEGRVYACDALCDLIHTEGAETLAVYTEDFYADMPCVTVNRFGKGRAYYIATCPEACYLDDFYRTVIPEAGVKPIIPELPAGVQVTRRGDLAFVMNFSGAPVEVSLPKGRDLLTGERTNERATLPVNGFRIVRLSPEGEN